MGYDPFGYFSFWDFFDIASFVDSANTFKNDMSLENAGWLVADLAGLAPILPSIGTVKAAKKVIDGVDAVNDTAKVAKKGWKVGDDITALTKSGKDPSWSTVRSRYWKNEAYYNASSYKFDDLVRMKKGKAPLVQYDLNGKWYSMEIHHIKGRNIPNPHRLNNLQQLTPWDHTFVDGYRHWKP